MLSLLKLLDEPFSFAILLYRRELGRLSDSLEGALFSYEFEPLDELRLALDIERLCRLLRRFEDVDLFKD